MNFILPSLTSLILTIIIIPLTIKFAKKFDLLDNPKLRPHPAHIQNRIVPRAGGLAPFIAVVICILFFLPINQHIGLILALSILLIIGLVDDKFRNISPYIRLIFQFIAAFIVVWGGVDINFVTNPLGGIIQFTDPFLAKLLALFWIVWVMNMLNWAKGVDGQMPGIVFVSSLILGVLSLKLFLAGDPNQFEIGKLAFITAGASLGLLIFNWHPARIFPGFSGSTIFGLLIATLAILSGAKLATAGLVLLIPATDFVYTVIRRILSGKSPVWGDRGHLHHKLLDRGLTHPQITCVYMLGSAMLGAAALTLNSRDKLFAAILVGTVILAIILWLNFFGGLSKQQDQDSG